MNADLRNPGLGTYSLFTRRSLKYSNCVYDNLYKDSRVVGSNIEIVLIEEA